MSDLELALRYAPIVHFDERETIFPRAVGFTVFRRSEKSDSFPKRRIEIPEAGSLVIEYAFYFDYDIGHMYDLEHVWVTVGPEGNVVSAQGSFHGKYLEMLVPELPGTLPPTDLHVHAFCQPGKHAFLAMGDLCRLVPGWRECCDSQAGGPVLIGNPFSAEYSPTGQDLFIPRPEDDENSIRYLRENLSFVPSLRFRERQIPSEIFVPWKDLYGLIPGWIREECERLEKLYAPGRNPV